MPRLIEQASKKIGLPPGSLIYIGKRETDEVKITILDYDEAQFQGMEIKEIEECFQFRDKPTVTWINIDGIHQIEIIEKIGKHFNLHPLILEDIVNTGQRPKMEDYGDYVFIVLKMLYYDGEEDRIVAEQVSLILGLNFVISFQEVEGDVFDPVRERIKNSKGRIRKVGADYLAYALVDIIVDNYFAILEKLEERIEDLEEGLLNPTQKNLREIHGLKREMAFLRKLVWPLREVVNSFERAESALVHESTRLYLRDLYDHTIQVIDTIETFREMLSGMLDIYLSSTGNRMNEVMKVLTVIATIFIPLTFIAGIYGMNFEDMPELKWHWGYPLALISMFSVGVLMLVYFRKKKWV